MGDKQIIKPTSLQMKEFRDEVANVINSSTLPISVIELIMDDINQEVKITAKQIAQQELTIYKQQIQSVIEQQKSKTNNTDE